MEEEAYAKLHGPGFTAYVKALRIVLGRRPNQEDSIHVSNEKIVSREHAIIEWDFESTAFKITCKGRNGMQVNRKRIDPDSPAEFLDNGSPIRIGHTCFYFLSAI